MLTHDGIAGIDNKRQYQIYLWKKNYLGKGEQDEKTFDYSSGFTLWKLKEQQV
jgi:hypothetical protein